MSINHILLDSVEDTEKLDVKFGILEADSISLDNITITDINVTNNATIGNELNVTGSSILKAVQAENINVTIGAEVASLVVSGSADVTNLTASGTAVNITCPTISTDKITTSANVYGKTHLFKSVVTKNSASLGAEKILSAAELVDGMLLFDDVGKIAFEFKMPSKQSLDIYLGLSGSDQYAFRFSASILPNVPTSASGLKLFADAVAGVFINVAGLDTKILPHTQTNGESYTFNCMRQSNGNYIIYG